VSGGQAGAENGVLTVMCGGTSGRLCRRRARDRRLCADVQAAGTGGFRSVNKDGDQICIAGPGAGPFGGHSFREKIPGLDVQAVVETISKGAAAVLQMEKTATRP